MLMASTQRLTPETGFRAVRKAEHTHVCHCGVRQLTRVYVAFMAKISEFLWSGYQLN